MTIVGKKGRFAVEVELAAESPRSIESCFGKFRFWVSGIAFGKDEPDSSCLAASRDALAERVSRGPTRPPEWIQKLSGIEALKAAYHWIYIAVPESGDDLAAQRCAQARSLVIAPDGDEAFDDGSFLLQWEVGENTTIVGCKIATVDNDNVTIESYRSCEISFAECVAAMNGALRELDAQLRTPR